MSGTDMEPSTDVNPDEAVAFGATVQVPYLPTSSLRQVRYWLFAGILTGQDFALMAGGSESEAQTPDPTEP
eukprot:2244269-Rhodomonas_salina.1